MSTTPKKTPKRGAPKLLRSPHYCTALAPERRATEIPTGTFTVKGGGMWCSSCEAVIQHKHKHFATYHLQSNTHERKVLVTKLPPSPQVQDPVIVEQATMEEQLSKANTEDLINEDLTAAFWGAGILLEKIDHLSLRGVLRKYTTIEGSMCSASSLRKRSTLEAVQRAHTAAINSFEHTKLVTVLLKAPTEHGLCPKHVAFFIPDGASVVGAAIQAAMPFFPCSRHVTCLAHTVNNCAKKMLMVAGFKDVTTFYDNVCVLVPAKRHGSRRRRWFGSLKSKDLCRAVPPKYVSTRWTCWRMLHSVLV
uniref:DUF659 domain-containing protein n=1 Tax=Eutreptiella gymnastica TaxID=73025 RepID=A0A7S4C710_9EUGL